MSYSALRNWAGKGFWAVTDQALFAGTNFMASILLARWLEPAAYGAFSVAYAVFLLLGTVHTGLWTEPMLVYGSGRFREAFTSYHRILLRYHWRFGALTALVFFLLSLGFWAWGTREIAKSFLGLTFAAPAVLYLWIVRRGAYVLLKPRLAAVGGGLYLLLYLGLSIALLRTSTLNATTAFLAMAVAGILSAEVIRWSMKTGTEQFTDTEEVRNLHWNYGRWALLAGLFSWVPGNIFYLILPAFHGLEAAAHFKALMNLLMPILHVNGALGQLLVPRMVRTNAQGGLSSCTKKALISFSFLSIVYLGFIIIAGDSFMKWIYNGKYTQDKLLLLWLGLIPLLGAIIVVLSSAFKATENITLLTKLYLCSTIFCFTAGIAFVLLYCIQGAVISMLFSYIILSIIFIKESGNILGMSSCIKV
jgi:O-antigen/teichoic acid export membrane protein